MKALLTEAEIIRSENVSANTKRSYNSAMGVYVKTMNQFIHENPYPVTHEKIVAFIVFQKNIGRKCSSLLSYINGFTYYFRENNLPILTQSIEFKTFKSGIRRVMHSGSYPNAKRPFDPKYFGKILEKFPITNLDNLRFMFLISLMYAAFLRINEALNIRKNDIIIENSNIIKLRISTSKTDQFGNGSFNYLYDNGSCYSPFRFVGYLNFVKDGELIEPRCQSTLRSHLLYVMRTIGVDNYEQYGFHSFRRGAAYHASLNNVNDCVTKAHGRWKSSAYVRYVAVDMSRAGKEISDALSEKKQN